MSDGRRVYVNGVGIHPFAVHTEATVEELSVCATREAVAASGLSIDAVQEAYIGQALGPAGAAVHMAEAIGLRGLPVTRIEQACASGSAALRHACEAVASGRCDVALALGAEKMGGGLLRLDETPSYSSRLGLDLFPLLYGLKTSQYMSD